MIDTGDGRILVERPVDGVAVLTLDRPHRRNAVTIALREAGCDALDELADDGSVRVVVVAGTAPAFCAGFDLGEFEQAAADEAVAARLWASADAWHRRWLTFPLPTIAAVNGPAIAGGFDVAAMCDLRVVAEDATFGHPEVRFGDVVYGPLHDLVGGAVARDLTFTGRVIGAPEAQRLGLVTRLVPAGSVVREAVALASQVAEAPRDSLLRLKEKAARRSRTVVDGDLDL